MDKDSRKEHLLYLVIWLTVFAAILLVMLLRKWTGGPPLEGRNMLSSWIRVLPFLSLFLLHDVLAAPLLLRRKKTGAYLLLTLLLYGLFAAAIFMIRPGPDGMGPRHGPPPPERPAWEAAPPRPDDRPGRPGPPDGPHHRPVDFEILCLALGALMIGANLGIKAYFQSRQDARALRHLQSEQQSRQCFSVTLHDNPS